MFEKIFMIKWITFQNHLLSVFDNTRLVTFDEKVYDKILAINSQEGEKIDLDESVNAQVSIFFWWYNNKMKHNCVNSIFVYVSSLHVFNPLKMLTQEF